MSGSRGSFTQPHGDGNSPLRIQTETLTLVPYARLPPICNHLLQIDNYQSAVPIPEKRETRPAQGLSGRIVRLLYNPGRVGGLVSSSCLLRNS
ncbi:hypothetical protein SBA2_430013 [Acidobacteriia bacterium SbA2]|nr:hypothetical protein SBA2_430013 [Acidobacteriia bacterium SbA2]